MNKTITLETEKLIKTIKHVLYTASNDGINIASSAARALIINEILAELAEMPEDK